MPVADEQSVGAETGEALGAGSCPDDRLRTQLCSQYKGKEGCL